MKQGHPETSWKKIYDGGLGKEIQSSSHDIGGLDINSVYEYSLYKSAKIFLQPALFTKDLGNGGIRLQISVYYRKLCLF